MNLQVIYTKDELATYLAMWGPLRIWIWRTSAKEELIFLLSIFSASCLIFFPIESNYLLTSSACPFQLFMSSTSSWCPLSLQISPRISSSQSILTLPLFAPSTTTTTSERISSVIHRKVWSSSFKTTSWMDENRSFLYPRHDVVSKKSPSMAKTLS